MVPPESRFSIINPKLLSKIQDPAYVRSIASLILQGGYVELDEFFSDEVFTKISNFGVELGFDDKSVNYNIETYPMKIARSPELIGFLDNIHKERCAITKLRYRPLRPDQQVIGFPTMNRQNYHQENPFHFDASNINAVLALRVTSDPDEGNLLLYPNLRKSAGLRLLGSLWARLLLHFPMIRSLVKPIRVQYKERALYLFFGDITFHSVAPISRGERIVMVFNNSTIMRNREG